MREHIQPCGPGYMVVPPVQMNPADLDRIRMIIREEMAASLKSKVEHLPQTPKTPVQCALCAGPDEQLCIVCERSICQQCLAPDLYPGDHAICVACDKVTPHRKQAYDHYWLRARLKAQGGPCGV